MLAISGLCLTAAPRSAHAVEGDRFEWHWYSRLGMAWSIYGQDINGKPLNLLHYGIGGRFEEGDYSEPTFVAHVVKPEKPGDFYVDSSLTFAMFPRNGSFIQGASNGFGDTLGFEINQAYIEAGNFLIPDLAIWGGARFYRDAYAPLGDYFYFDDLTGQGGGIKYKGLDFTIIGQTGPAYQFASSAAPGAPLDILRTRTIFVSNYKYEFGPKKSYVKARAELHVVPPADKGPATPQVAHGDAGGVFGVKLHLQATDTFFTDSSIRLGTGIANGAAYGEKSFKTWGAPKDDGTYGGALGLEVVNHTGVDIGPLLTLNTLLTLHYSKAAGKVEGTAGAPPGFYDKEIDGSIQANANWHLHKQFNLVTEASFQAVKNGDQKMGTLIKGSIVPTIIPTGPVDPGPQPQFKLIYSVGAYNQASLDQVLSPYIATTGTTSDKIGHYIGARTDWYF